jgi:hypothetical protein
MTKTTRMTANPARMGPTIWPTGVDGEDEDDDEG